MTHPPAYPAAASPEADAPRPRRSLPRKLLLCLGAVVLALVLAEALLHLLGVEVRADRLARDPVLGWRNKPGWRGPVFSVNSLGFLGDEFSPQKPEGAVRIFCLGDSTTAGDLLPSFDESYPRQLARALAQRAPSRGVEVINAGCGGYSSFQGRTWLERQILGYEPDLIVLYFGWNDHWPARAGGEDKVVSGCWSERLRAWLSWCKLLQLAIRAAHVARGQAVLPDAGTATAAVPHADRPPRVALDDYAANLRAMTRAVRQRGGDAVLLTAPNYLALDSQAESASVPGGRPAAAALVALHASYNAVVRQVAREEDACLVDAAGDFAKAADPARLFWRPPDDFIHPSAEGYARLAALVADSPAVGRLLEGR